MSDTEVCPKIFLTDYGSYNEGRQFEFGHWLDLENFDSYEDLMDYITKHFKECDQRSPLHGGIREEIMITDFEGFPKNLYSETGNLGNVMAYLDVLKESSYSIELIEAYLEVKDFPERIADLEEEINSCYIGEFENNIEFAQSCFEHLDIPEQLPYSCIDWNCVARDLDFIRSNGYYFN